MNRKTLTIILALALFGAFFLPFLLVAIGFDIVFKTGSGNGDWEKYIWLLIPISAILLLIGALNNGSYFLSRGVLSWLPLLTVIYIILRLYLDIKPPISEFIQLFAIGFWATLVISVVLAFYNPRKV